MLPSLIRILAPYFDKDERSSFIDVQRQTGTLISGSTVLSFFTDANYPGSDLDLYVNHARRTELIEFIQRVGYAFVARPGSSRSPESTTTRLRRPPHAEIVFNYQQYTNSAIVAVFDFKKPQSSQVIQIILTTNTPVQAILNFHSTCVMNFISHTRAVSLYPSATFMARTSLWTHKRVGNIVSNEQIIEKYTNRGWTYQTKRTCPESVDRRNALRRVGDEHCWMVHLQNGDDDLRTLCSNTWVLKYPSQGGGFLVDYGILRSPNMDETYCVADYVRDIIPMEVANWDDQSMHAFVSYAYDTYPHTVLQ